MFIKRKRFHDLMDELDRFIEEMEKEAEDMIRAIYESGKKALLQPMIYGFSIKVGPEGEPTIRTFGDRKLLNEGYREPVYDQFVDEGRGELKLFVELPGMEKEDIELQAIEKEATISASRDGRKYQAGIELKAPVDPSSASATYRNGVLEVTFKLKKKANKDYRKIRVE